MATGKPDKETPQPTRSDRLLAAFHRMREAAEKAPLEARAEREYLQASVDAQLILAAVQLETLAVQMDIAATLHRIEQQGLGKGRRS